MARDCDISQKDISTVDGGPDNYGLFKFPFQCRKGYSSKEQFHCRSTLKSGEVRHLQVNDLEMDVGDFSAILEVYINHSTSIVPAH